MCVGMSNINVTVMYKKETLEKGKGRERELKKVDEREKI